MSRRELNRKILIAIVGLLIFSVLLAYGSTYLGLVAIVPLLIVICVLLFDAWPRGDFLIPFERSRKTAHFQAGQISKMAFSSNNAASGSIFSRSEIASILREGLRNRKETDSRGEKLGPLQEESQEGISHAILPKEVDEILSYGKGEQEKNPSIVFRLRNNIIRKDKNYLRKLERALDYLGENFK